MEEIQEESGESSRLNKLREKIFSYQNSLRNYIFVFLTNRMGRYPIYEEIENVLNDTLEKAHRKVEQFRYGNLGDWLGGIARNNCKDYLRNYKRNPDKTLAPYHKPLNEDLMGHVLSSSLPPWRIKSPKRITKLKDLLSKMSDEFERMTKKRKDVLRLRIHHGMKHKEIAKELGISEEASKSLFYRAIKQLRESYEKHQKRQKLMGNLMARLRS